jgi:hypothetical protein
VTGWLMPLIAVLAAEPAVAPPSLPNSMSISWTAPAGCPDEAALKEDVRRLAGTAATPTEAILAGAVVERAADGAWQLALTTRAGSFEGERQLVAADCGELERAAALVIALMINPDAGTTALESRAPAPLRAPPTLKRVEVVDVPPRRRWALGIDITLGAGTLPALGPGIGLRARAGQRWSGEVITTLWASRQADSAAEPSAGGSFTAVDVGAAGCFNARSERRLAPSLCVGADLNRVAASGFGVTDPGHATGYWLAGFVEGAGRWFVTPRGSVRLSLMALVAGGRPQFSLAGVGPVFQPPILATRCSLGWELDF